jgi:hypothetical protein
MPYHNLSPTINICAPSRRRRAQPERAIQRAVLDHLAWRAPAGVMWFHIPNGGYRKPVEAAILKADGVISGMPDLGLVVAGRAYFLELKAPGGRLSQTQRDCHEMLRAAGAVVMTAAGVDEAMSALQDMGILPEGRR